MTGRARMALIPDFKNTTLLAFLKQNVMPGSTVYTDGVKASKSGELLWLARRRQLKAKVSRP